MFKNFKIIASSILRCPQLVFEQKRTTFILKRRFEPRLNKLGSDFKRKLKRRDYYYELVENTNATRRNEKELILLKNVDGIGIPGEIIKRKSVIAYEHYIITGVATYATPENISKYSSLKNKSDMPFYVKNIITELSVKTVPVCMHGENPWTLEPWHIKLAFRKYGITCNDNCITMPEKTISGPNLELEQKDFIVKITVNGKYTVPVRCRLFHIVSGKDFDLTFNSNFWKESKPPIFPEDKIVLDSLPIYTEKKSFFI